MSRSLLLLITLAIGCEQSLEIGSVSDAETNHDTAPAFSGSGGGLADAPAALGGAPEAEAGGSTSDGTSAGMPAATAGTQGTAGAVSYDTLWSSGVEAGDTSDWTRDGAAAGGEYVHSASLQASTEQAHSGRYSAKISFDTSDNQNHWAELYRPVVNGAAYYSAWFYLDAAHAPAVYWTLFDFFSESTAGDLATRRGLWDLNLNATSLYFYDEISGQFADASPAMTYPIGRWFQIEAYVDFAPPAASHLSVWQDGSLIFDRVNLQSPAGASLYFGIGSQTDQLSPANCNLYIDDVVISRHRVGP